MARPTTRGEDRHREADQQRDAGAVEHAANRRRGPACRCRTSIRADGSRVRRAGASAVRVHGPEQRREDRDQDHHASSRPPPMAMVGWRQMKPTKPLRLHRRQDIRHRRRDGHASGRRSAIDRLDAQ